MKHNRHLNADETMIRLSKMIPQSHRNVIETITIPLYLNRALQQHHQ